jgi:hypothetical protein
VILADKGSDIVVFRYKPRDLDFLLAMPGSIRNPQSGYQVGAHGGREMM